MDTKKKDLGRNTGFVVVGTDHDTAAFAVAGLRRWWTEEGRAAYPHAKRLLMGHHPEPIPARLIGPSDLANYVMHATAADREGKTTHSFIDGLRVERGDVAI
ncbi:ISAzo13-like element transposase-related protein [Streptomyces hebeiensis]|uniref:ISAzo13-like element transposase-related protein n=1 Tax=Streptomyces hebeiensis TaxID=229486 RepID=UPI003CD0B7A4